MSKQRGIEPNQPLGGPFARFLPCPPRLASARLRRPHQKFGQKSSPRGASQFSRRGRVPRQEKRRREYPLIFSRSFPQRWRSAARENLTGFDPPLLKPHGGLFTHCEVGHSIKTPLINRFYGIQTEFNAYPLRMECRKALAFRLSALFRTHIMKACPESVSKFCEKSTFRHL